MSTLEEKSLGCVQKGGTSTIEDILDYGEYISKNGLNILKGSGNDQVSCTNLTASGTNIILFTTGRGTPFGSIVPTLKISSNSNIYKKKNNWIDFNAGRILENMPVNDIVNELFELVINVASGKIQTKNEKNGYREISIFRDGIIL
nr:UxaA family hydrolase [Brachyspira aalborgi]